MPSWSLNPALRLMMLSAAADPIPAPPAGQPAAVAGKPAAYFWKDLIHLGNYVHPIKHYPISVDEKRLSNWANTGRQMLAAGIPVPINCDHSDSAHEVVGYVKDFKIDGDKLMGLCQFIGPDAALLAARNFVSPGINPDFTDGQTHNWGDAIVHVALTPVPVVPDQDPFLIAASRLAAAGTCDVLMLSAAAQTPPLLRSPIMDKNLKCSQASLDHLHTLVPGLSDCPEDEKLSRVAQHLKTLCSMEDDDAGGSGAIAQMSRAQIHDTAAANRKKWKQDSTVTVQTLSTAAAQKDREIQDLRAKTVNPLDAEAEAALLDNLDTKLGLCLISGAIDKPTKDGLFAILGKNESGKVNTLTLSRGASNGSEKALAIRLVEILMANKPTPKPGSATALQTLSFNPGGAPPTDKTLADLQANMIAQANVGQPKPA